MMNEPEIYGKNLFGETVLPPKRGLIADEFLVPPFSVLNGREGFWQERKQAWKSLGIENEIARTTGGNNCIGEWRHRETEQAESTQKMMAAGDGVLFDPVLCELAYRWFCEEGGMVLDPFAGGSVRGIVAEMLNRRYYGIDLRQEQIEANKAQAAGICPGTMPTWVCGDSMEELTGAPQADLIFTCPPYGDLEKYSDDPRDLSAMEYHTFIAAYKRIIMRACVKLRNNRFACIVVGDFRDERGNYRNFVSDTIAAFREQGLELYNEAILVTMVGSLSMRIKKQFDVSRKMGKTHQNVLVFVKGSGKEAAKQVQKVV
jgi:DNA modification methylase